MTATEKKLWITAGVLALAAIGSSTAWILDIIDATRSHIDSPITASGGSMTFRAKSGWTCSSAKTGMPGMNDFCWAQTNISKFEVEDIQDDLGNQIGNANQSSGTVYFNLRMDDGSLNPPFPNKPKSTPPPVPYIALCTSDSNDPKMGGCNGKTKYVLVRVYGPNSSLVTSKAFENNASVFAVQYFDTTCDVHDAALHYVPGCEHPGWVLWGFDNKYYRCKHGGCRLFLTQ